MDPYEQFDFTVLECPNKPSLELNHTSDDDVLNMRPTEYPHSTERSVSLKSFLIFKGFDYDVM